jgi:glycosyltransferase involved in cell wall biosynthesis
VAEIRTKKAKIQAKAPLSVIVLTKNEEANLEGCLESLRFAAEVVVVDSESSDRTRAIAKAMGARVFNRPWPGFTAQRNFAVDQCRQPWVLSVDADERLSPELMDEIRTLLQGKPECDGYRIPEVNNYFGRWLRHGGIYPSTHLILFKRAHARYESQGADVHEGVRLEREGLLKGHLIHHAYPDISLALDKLNRYTDLEAEGRLKQGRGTSPRKLWFKPVWRFLRNYIAKRGFLDGAQGLLYCALTGYYAFVIELKIWEKQSNPGS